MSTPLSAWYSVPFLSAICCAIRSCFVTPIFNHLSVCDVFLYPKTHLLAWSLPTCRMPPLRKLNSCVPLSYLQRANILAIVVGHSPVIQKVNGIVLIGHIDVRLP